MMSKGAVLAAAIGIGAIIAAGGAFAHDDKMPANASAATKAAYARHELRKGSPDKAVIASNARIINTQATALPTWFPRGSGVTARPMSEAKNEIWTDAAGFTAAASNLRAQAGKLNTVAASGDIDAIKAQVRPTFQACKGCHEKYRQEQKG